MLTQFKHCGQHKGLANQQGVGLVEVLVTVLVLAVGLLGLAALQARSLKASGDAQAMQMAVQYASDYFERMRSNRTNMTAYTMSAEQPTCSTTVPLTGSLATNDRALWLNALACSFPQATATVTLAGTRATITVAWLDRLDSSSAEPVQQSMVISSEI